MTSRQPNRSLPKDGSPDGNRPVEERSRAQQLRSTRSTRSTRRQPFHYLTGGADFGEQSDPCPASTWAMLRSSAATPSTRPARSVASEASDLFPPRPFFREVVAKNARWEPGWPVVTEGDIEDPCGHPVGLARLQQGVSDRCRCERFRAGGERGSQPRRTSARRQHRSGASG
jgi:hypothetical protein